MSSRPVGTRAGAGSPKYSSMRLAPTCSAMPIELIASNGSSPSSAVVLQADLHLVADARLADPLPRQLGLLAADRDADGVDPVAGRRVDHHRAPPAPDVEQAHARSLVEPELAGDEIVLGRLGVVERLSSSTKRAHE